MLSRLAVIGTAAVSLLLAAMPSAQPIKPPLLEPGDTIAIIAPAYPLREDRVDLLQERLEALGFKIKRASNIFTRYGYLADTDDVRAATFMEAWLDPEVDAVFPGTGGYGTTRMLDQLDYEAIAANPKVFIGFSDITGLHLAINRRANLVTFHTPNPLWGLGSPGGMHPYAERAFFKNILANPRAHDWNAYDAITRRELAVEDAMKEGTPMLSELGALRRDIEDALERLADDFSDQENGLNDAAKGEIEKLRIGLEGRLAPIKAEEERLKELKEELSEKYRENPPMGDTPLAEVEVSDGEIPVDDSEKPNWEEWRRYRNRWWRKNDSGGWRYFTRDAKDNRPKTYVAGEGQGRLTGGNLSLIHALMGSKYEIETEGRIVFIEDVGEDPYRVDRMFSNMELAGKLDNPAAVLLCTWRGCTADNPERSLTLDQVFERYFADRDYPVVRNWPAGHVTENGTLPVGVMAKVVAPEEGRPTLRLLESPGASN